MKRERRMQGFPVAPAVAVFLVFVCAASLSSAEPSRVDSPLDRLAALRGHVEIRSEGPTAVVTTGRIAGEVDRLFRVETGGASGLPASFQADSAQILFWKGHLVVIAPREGKAFHVSIPGLDLGAGADRDAQQRPPATADLDSFLGASYELTRVDGATAIISLAGPAARRAAGDAGRNLFQAKDVDYQDYGTGGVGGCGVSCSIACGDGSSCSASCVANRCAKCTCPAFCSCS